MRHSWIILLLFGTIWGCQPMVPPGLPPVVNCQQDLDCPASQRCSQGVCALGERSQADAAIDAAGEPSAGESTRLDDEPGVADEPKADVPPEKTPDASPDKVPDVSPEKTPDVSPEKTPDVSPEKTPDNIAEMTPERPSERTPETSCQEGSKRSCFDADIKLVNKGICRAGTQTCVNAAWSKCAGQVLPATESCNGKDDDCNGKVDDGLGNPPKACTAAKGPLGVACTNGTIVCQAGKEVCVGPMPKTETLTQHPTLGNTPGKLMPCKPAGFGSMFGVAIDPVSKAIYLSDDDNHTIRRYDPTTEKVTTIAGSRALKGHVNGPVSSARFNGPHGLRWYGGALYVADRYNHVIRKLTPLVNGTCGTVTPYTGFCVSTVVGIAGQSGFSKQSVALAQAMLKEPRDIDFDTQGQMYIVDTGNHAIRKVDTAGNVSTIAGTGLAIPPARSSVVGKGLSMDMPLALVVGKNGVVYVAEADSHVIRTIEPSGTMRILAGVARASGYLDAKNPHTARFSSPIGVALDAKEEFLYVSDFNNYVLRKVDLRKSKSGVSTVAGQRGLQGTNNAIAAASRFHKAIHITFAPDGKLLIVERQRRLLRYYTPPPRGGTALVGLLAGHSRVNAAIDGDALCASLEKSAEILLDRAKNHLYVAAYKEHLLFRIDLTAGRMEQYAGTGQTPPAPPRAGTLFKVHRLGLSLNEPYGLAQSTTGTLLVAELANHQIRQIDGAGLISPYAGAGSGNADGDKLNRARFHLPAGMSFDLAGNLFVADIGNHLIRKIDTNGNVTSLAGYPNFARFKDGKGRAAYFHQPVTLAAVPGGFLYVADKNNHRIRKVDMSGNVTTPAGANKGDGDGTGLAAMFSSPWKIIALPNKSFLISETGNHKLRLMTPAGVVSTYLGTGTNGNTEGERTKATLTEPTGLAFDANNNILYIAQHGAGGLRRFKLCGP